jgi:hypothetical protein
VSQPRVLFFHAPRLFSTLSFFLIDALAADISLSFNLQLGLWL